MIKYKVKNIKCICITLFLIFLIKFLFFPYDIGYTKSKEFRIELNDVNILYYFYGYGKHGCIGNYVLIATPSEPNSFEIRMAIRNSWKKDIPSSMNHKFFIGAINGEDKELQEALIAESWQFGDIIFTNIIDHYSNLTLKMNTIFQWQQAYCPEVQYFLRVDENTVLDVKRFEYFLNQQLNLSSKILNNMAIFGYAVYKSIVSRNPEDKWYVPYEAYANFCYPDYIKGHSYLMASKTVGKILEEAKTHKHIIMDDAFYTGIVAEAAEIKVMDAKENFAIENPLEHRWKRECDENEIPLLFSIVIEGHKLVKAQPKEGYMKALKKLKALKC